MLLIELCWLGEGEGKDLRLFYDTFPSLRTRGLFRIQNRAANDSSNAFILRSWPEKFYVEIFYQQ